MHLAIATVRADTGPTSGCASTPIQNVQAAQARIRAWADATELPPFDKDRSQLSIDRSNTRLTLRFALGELTVAWALDDACRPHEIEIQVSGGYDGARPDEAAVRRLAAELEAVSASRPVAEPYVPGRHAAGPARTSPRAWWGVGASAAALGLLLLALRRWKTVVRARGSRATALARALGSRVQTLTRALGASAADLARALASRAGTSARALASRSAATARALVSRASVLIRRAREASASSWIRWIALLPNEVSPSGTGAAAWLAANVVVFVGVLPVVAFLWFAASGSNVDVHAALPDPRLPWTADLGLYRVVGVKR